MIGEIVQLFPLLFFTVLAFWHPDWLKGILFLVAGMDSFVVGLTWRQTFYGPAGLGTALCLIAFSFIMVVFFLKVLLARRPAAEDSEEEE